MVWWFLGPRSDQSVEVNNCYTTWKVEGTIPMHWFIMAPYFSPLFGLAIAIYCQYVFGDAATWLARLVSANEPANMVIMLKNISYKSIRLKHTNLGNLDLVPIIWPVISISIMSISLLFFFFFQYSAYCFGTFVTISSDLARRSGVES